MEIENHMKNEEDPRLDIPISLKKKLGFLSIGYGRRTIAHFITLLHQHQVACLIDVRSRPFSRFNPDFSRKRLESHLAAAGIEYVFMGDTLGGMPDDPSCYSPEGKIDYARVRQQAFFQEGLERLRRFREQGVCAALMCAETKPEMCHRTHLIGAALAEEGMEILHLDENDGLLTQAGVLARLG
jgi:uncharacterized protein (DUF488 family)